MAVVRVKFTKMSGAGNDFIIIDNRRAVLEVDESTFARAVSDRRRGVGADGVLLLEESASADFLMKYYNADGSFGGFCGNGGRCIARYAYLHKIAPAVLSFESLDFVYHAEVDRERVRLKMKDPANEMLNLSLQVDEKALKMHFIDTGAPHVVMFQDENVESWRGDLSSLDVLRLGKEIRSDAYFGTAGTNVNFVRLNPDQTLSIRTYERGVEGETLACGTGSVASALIASRVKGLPSPVKIIPKSQEPLVVEFHHVAQRFTNAYLGGNAKVVFKGELTYDTVNKKLVQEPEPS